MQQQTWSSAWNQSFNDHACVSIIIILPILSLKNSNNRNSKGRPETEALNAHGKCNTMLWWLSYLSISSCSNVAPTSSVFARQPPRTHQCRDDLGITAVCSSTVHLQTLYVTKSSQGPRYVLSLIYLDVLL